MILQVVTAIRRLSDRTLYSYLVVVGAYVGMFRLVYVNLQVV